jgi:hypothetical protein
MWIGVLHFKLSPIGTQIEVDTNIYINETKDILRYQNIIQFGCLTLPLLWLVTILFYAAAHHLELLE